MIENLRELNVLAGESEVHFESDNQRHISTLKRTEPINITLYANGIFLFNGPFRPFSGRIFIFLEYFYIGYFSIDPSTQQFVRDILDGFFPSELQKRFPDGVPFNVSKDNFYSSFF
jgi:hypothetical protein